MTLLQKYDRVTSRIFVPINWTACHDHLSLPLIKRWVLKVIRRFLICLERDVQLVGGGFGICPIILFENSIACSGPSSVLTVLTWMLSPASFLPGVNHSVDLTWYSHVHSLRSSYLGFSVFLSCIFHNFYFEDDCFGSDKIETEGHKSIFFFFFILWTWPWIR